MRTACLCWNNWVKDECGSRSTTLRHVGLYQILLRTTNILRQIALTHILTRKHERAKYNVWLNLELCQSVYLHRKEIGTCSRKYKLLGVWVIKLFLPQSQQNGIIFIDLMGLFTHFLLLLVSSLSPSHVCSLLPTLSKQNWFYKTK